MPVNQHNTLETHKNIPKINGKPSPEIPNIFSSRIPVHNHALASYFLPSTISPTLEVSAVIHSEQVKCPTE